MRRSLNSPTPNIVVDNIETKPKSRPQMNPPLNKRNSLPAITLKTYDVMKRASIFESLDSNVNSPKSRDRSPCGNVETSERKMEARRERRKKQEMGAKKKRQADPYAEESTECDEDAEYGVIADKTIGNSETKDSQELDETIVCPHANKAVNFPAVKRLLKHIPPGECTVCSRAKSPLGFLDENSSEAKAEAPVIWLCTYCGNQGCDRASSSSHKHAFRHYKTPRSDCHCLVINIHTWTVWCYECNSEVHSSSSKLLDKTVTFVKKAAEMAPRRNTSTLLTPSRSYTNLTSQFSGSDSRLHLSTHEDNHKSFRTNRYAASLESIPKVKGLSNLGNTCFFNSVMQALAQTHLMAQLLDLRLQSGHRMTLPGDPVPLKVKKNTENMTTEETVELKPLELHLPEGGSLSLALASFLKDIHAMGKSNIINPSHLFGIICKKNQQFQGYQQQDAHELLRCLLDSIRNEEIIRYKKAILKAFMVPESANPNKIGDKLKTLIKAYGAQANHTIVEEIFGGQMISTVCCDSCHWSSQIFEPMMDLSLPINDIKGKHKKSVSQEDEGFTDCFGRGVNGHDKKLSKREMRRLKNLQTKEKQTKNKSKAASNKVNESIQRRLTEKRLPDDTSETLEREEMNKKFADAKKNALEDGKESSKFKELKPVRSEQSGSSSENEGLEEDDSSDSDDTFGVRKGQKTLMPIVRGSRNVVRKATPLSQPQELNIKKSAGNDEGTDESSSKQNSRANSDADVEDNADSEGAVHTIQRHPSIVVDQLSDDLSAMELRENRPIKSCMSGDHLNYNSASDNSEKYFTAGVCDTMDELEAGGDNMSLRSDTAPSITTTTSGKGDSLSISSGDTLPANSDDTRIFADQTHMDGITVEVEELKIRNRSECKTSLAESTHGSTETLHTFNEHDNQNKDNTIKKLKSQWMTRSLTTLAHPYQSNKQEWSIMSCLSSFTSPELLTGLNKITCENCTKRRNEREGEKSEPVKSSASKQLLIFSPPAVLTLHLKRFEHTGIGLCKVNRFVQFPFVIDIAPFTSSISLGLPNMESGQSQVIYGLYGIVEHSGRLNNGHYVAYVRSRPLDPSRIRKQLLNLKPFSQFVSDKLMEEMTNKGEFEDTKKFDPEKKKNMEELDEEIRQSRWFYASDSDVSEVSIEKVAKAQAYLLFYERIC